MTDRYDLLERHHQTLDVLNGAGDMVTSNEPFVPSRRRSPRFRASWNTSGIHISFRDDIDTETRQAASRWRECQTETSVATVPRLDALAECFGVAASDIGQGMAYTTSRPVQATGDAVLISEANVGLLPEGSLEEGELDFAAPSYALIRDGRAVSTAQTVRRIPQAIEVGVDTLEAYRGKGYAVAVTSVWVNEALKEGLIPFYSTSSGNRASQRVAEKVGLGQFAADLRIL